MIFSKTLRDWVQFSDRDKAPYNPTINTMITIEQLLDREADKFDSQTWQREEWLYKAALVPVEQLYEAAHLIQSPDNLKFGIGWDIDGQFDFGNRVRVEGLEIYPIVTEFEHPISEELSVELVREFVSYHALQRRNESQYHHPIDNLLVAETTIDTHHLYKPTPRVTIHRDYLKDFLAATGLGLLISVVADRFANALTEEELELEQTQNLRIDEHTWLSTSIHPPRFTGHKYYRGRAILNQNYVVEPYATPKYERSPWPYFGEKSVSEEEQPKFIVNDEGEKKVLPRDTFLANYVKNGIGYFGYLYFRPEVLQKFLQTPGYTVFFHMRNWGTASIPGDRGSIDVGINTKGLITAFAPDIAELNVDEQSYRASFSSLPSGEICDEMFQTRMQLIPPNSLGTIDLILGVRTKLQTIFQERFSVNLYSDYSPNKQEMSRLSVGVIGAQYSEVIDLAKTLYGWLIETMQIDSLRTVLSSCGGNVDRNLRQIKLLENILMARGADLSQARSITAPLVGLNDLRIASAHAGNFGLETSIQLMGVQKIPTKPRDGWFACVDAVIASLHSITDML